MIRNRFILLAAFLWVWSALFASNPKEGKTKFYRHEISASISYGDCLLHVGWGEDYLYSALSQAASDYKNITGMPLYYKGGDSWFDFHNNYVLSYYYNFNRHISVGLVLGGSSLKDTNHYTAYAAEWIDNGATTVKGSTFFLMPSVKLRWLNNSWCSLYMKATGGILYQCVSIDPNTVPIENASNYKESRKKLAHYITPFGWEVGKSNVRCFMEIGFGTKPNIQVGLTYRFDRR